jgi:tetratricopeptide (TPR) repeat protein
MLCFSHRSICCSIIVSLIPFAALAEENRASPNTNSVPGIQPATAELRGDIMMAQRRFVKAVEMYRLADPKSPIVANKIGIAYHQMHLLSLAKKSYERAVKLNPKYSDAINNLGTIYYGEKRYRKSITYYRKAMHCSPSPSATIASNIGSAYFARKKYSDAAEWYEKAVRIDPEVFDRHSSAGTVMQERTIAERAIFHLYLAKTYAKSGIKDRALVYLRQALEEGVKNPNKIPEMPEFAGLRGDLRFQQLMALQN